MAKTLKQLQTVEVARLLSVTMARVSQLVKEGKLKVAAKLGDGTPLFDPREVERLKLARIDQLVRRVETLKST